MDNNENTRPVCSCCGATIETDDYYTFDGNILCDDCYHSETVVCEHCGDRIRADDNAGTDSMPLCNSCYDDYYTTCECCGRIIHRDYANYDDDDDYAYCDRCYEERQNSSIHEYNYKPEPIFYGDSKRYFGVELEIDEGGKNGDNADTLLGIGNRVAEHIYIKSDGSLNDGMEIVTHPMSLKYHKDKMPWAEIMRSAIRMVYRSHKTSTCGLHVHVNRTAFGSTREAQDECISRVLYFVEHHWLELLKFSRRTEYQMNRWAARYGYKNSPKEILEDAKKGCNGRYACVNITNYHTIEFRMFRGTLKYNTLIATMELVDKICELATNLTVKTDSYIAVQLLEQQKTLDIQSISEMAELVEGSFVFTVLDDKNNIYFVKGDNPLALYHYETCGLFVYASTEAILDRALARLGIISIEHQKINTTCGDILKIDSTGALEQGMFDTTNLMMYDYRYFRRDWWNVPESCESEPQDVKQLKDFASSIGVSREDIDLLLSYGYFVEEIEEMLYQPGVIEEALCEILDECAYDYCGEF